MEKAPFWASKVVRYGASAHAGASGLTVMLSCSKLRTTAIATCWASAEINGKSMAATRPNDRWRFAVRPVLYAALDLQDFAHLFQRELPSGLGPSSRDLVACMPTQRCLDRL